MDEKAYEALSKIKNLIDAGDSPEGLAKEYDKWSSEYDNDTAAIGYKVPPHAAELVLKSFSDASTNETKILDVACGTGLVGKALRELGFKGILHGIDGSENMVECARAKKCYDELFVQLLSPQKKISTPAGEKYNAVICTGAFTKNHLEAKLILQLVELLATEGILVFSIRDSDDNASIFQQLKEEVNILKESGLLEEICSAQTSHNVNWNVEGASASASQITPSTLHVFCMRRL